MLCLRKLRLRPRAPLLRINIYSLCLVYEHPFLRPIALDFFGSFTSSSFKAYAIAAWPPERCIFDPLWFFVLEYLPLRIAIGLKLSFFCIDSPEPVGTWMSFVMIPTTRESKNGLMKGVQVAMML